MAGNFIVFRVYIYVPGALIRSLENNTNENVIYTGHNGAFDNITGHQHTGAPGDAPNIAADDVTIIDAGGYYTSTNVEGALQEIGAGFQVPIGTILPFYDYNNQLTFNVLQWHYCDGSIQNVGSIGPQTLPDLSGRYLVGFGTIGGGDIGTAPFNTAPVGVTTSTLDLQHNHTGPSHTHNISAHDHTGPSHTHTFTTDASGTGATGGPSVDATDNSGGSTTGSESSHTHSAGNIQVTVASFNSATRDFSFFDSAGTPVVAFTEVSTYQSASNNTPMHYQPGLATQDFNSTSPAGSTGPGSAHSHSTPNHTHTLSAHTHTGPSHTHAGTTDASGTGLTSSVALVTDASGTGLTGNALANSTDIRPSSIRVRFIMRIA